MTHGHLLDEAEKRRFCEWLRLKIETSRGIQEQMRKLCLPSAITSYEHNKEIAYSMVLKDIEGAEVVSLTK